MTAHAILRAKERFGIDLTEHDVDLAKRQIQNGEALILDAEAHQWLVKIKGQFMRAVYDEGVIKTFLPRRKLQHQRGNQWRRPQARRARKHSLDYKRRKEMLE